MRPADFFCGRILKDFWFLGLGLVKILVIPYNVFHKNIS